MSARRGRRSAARRCAGSTGTPPGGAARPRRAPSCAPGHAGAGAPVSWSSRPSGGTLRGLAGLLADVLVLVADALALVPLGLADLADVRADLADELPFAAAHDDLGRRGDLELDALGLRPQDRVRVAALHLEVLAL